MPTGLPNLNLSLSDSSRQYSGLGDNTLGGFTMGSLNFNQKPDYITLAFIAASALLIYKAIK